MGIGFVCTAQYGGLVGDTKAMMSEIFNRFSRLLTLSSSLFVTSQYSNCWVGSVHAWKFGGLVDECPTTKKTKQFYGNVSWSIRFVRRVPSPESESNNSQGQLVDNQAGRDVAIKAIETINRQQHHQHHQQLSSTPTSVR